MPKEAYQQWDMFKGEPVTVYGRVDQQPLRQMSLFSINEIVQLGVSAHPWLKEMPTPSLTLERQDARTEEEKERDRMREAEKLTTPLFADTRLPAVITEPTSDTLESSDAAIPEPQSLFLGQYESQIDADETVELEDNEDEQDVEASPNVRPSKYEAYLALVNMAAEQAATLYSTPPSELSETIMMSKAKLDAQLAGLTGVEIIAALTVGECRGKVTPQPEQTTEPEYIAAQAIDIDAPIAVAVGANASRYSVRLLRTIFPISQTLRSQAWAT